MSDERGKSPAAQSTSFDPSILDRLACPVCLEGLRSDESCLHCEGCGRVYPIVDGIPVLIAERAIPPKS